MTAPIILILLGIIAILSIRLRRAAVLRRIMGKDLTEADQHVKLLRDAIADYRQRWLKVCCDLHEARERERDLRGQLYTCGKEIDELKNALKAVNVYRSDCAQLRTELDAAGVEIDAHLRARRTALESRDAAISDARKAREETLDLHRAIEIFLSAATHKAAGRKNSFLNGAIEALKERING